MGRIEKNHAILRNRISEDQTGLCVTLASDNHIIVAYRHGAVKIIDAPAQQHRAPTNFAYGFARLCQGFGVVGVIVCLGAEVLD